MVTAGKPAKIGLHADKSQLEPDGQDLLISILMYWINQGNWVPTASNQLHFEIEGPARIVGVDNGRQPSRERYQAQKMVGLRGKPSMAEVYFWFRAWSRQAK